MMIKNNKYLILRRMVQFSIILLFVGGSYFDWTVLRGNYSTAEVLGAFNLSDPYAVLQILASGFIPGTSIVVGALIVSVFYFLIRGRFFCSWVCPLNIVTDTAAWLHRILHIQPLVSAKRINRRLRYYVLALGLVISAIMGFAAFEAINPISMFHRAFIFGSLSGLLVVLFVFVFDLFILKHGWCGHLCPVGAFYSILGNFGFLKVYHTKENCTACMKCKVVCPEVEVLDIIDVRSGTINQGACTNCGRCIDKCDDDSLKFKITIK